MIHVGRRAHGRAGSARRTATRSASGDLLRLSAPQHSRTRSTVTIDRHSISPRKTLHGNAGTYVYSAEWSLYIRTSHGTSMASACLGKRNLPTRQHTRGNSPSDSDVKNQEKAVYAANPSPSRSKRPRTPRRLRARLNRCRLRYLPAPLSSSPSSSPKPGDVGMARRHSGCCPPSA